MNLLKLIQLFMCVFAIWAYKQDDLTIKPLDDKIGTLLITEDPIAFTSFTWRLIFEWDLTPLKTTLDNLKHVNQNLTRVLMSEVEKEALIHVSETLETAEVEYNNFMNLIRGTSRWYNTTRAPPTPAPKPMPFRSQRKRQTLQTPDKLGADIWRGSTGSFMSSLLGVASAEEMDNVHSLLDTLFRREAKMITIEKYHITTLKQVQSQIDVQQEQIDRMVNFTAGVYQVVKEALEGRNDTSYASLLLHGDFVNAVGLFKTTILNHRRIIAALDRGYLDQDLIPPKILQDTLLEVRNAIPSGFKLIFDPTKMNLQPYYHLKLATRIIGSSHVRGLLQIPLTGITDDYTLYRSVPFPSSFDDKSKRRFILRDVTRYIALSADRKKFMDLDSVFNPTECLRGPTLVCPASTSVLSDPSAHCLFHLISGQINTDKESKCHLDEVFDNDTHIQGIDTEEWAVSAPNPTMLQHTCINIGSEFTTNTYPAQTVRGDLVIHIPRRCSVTVGHHTIPMRVMMTSNMEKLPSRLNLPPIHSHQLLNLHGTKMLDEKMTKELNRALKELIMINHDKSLFVNATSKDVREMITKMTQDAQEISRIQPTFHYHVINWTFVSFCIVCIIALAYWVRKKAKKPQVVDRSTRIVTAEGVRLRQPSDVTAAATTQM